MKIGLFGGTFDPIHQGHLSLARAALKNLKLTRIYFVVAKRPPHKPKNPITTSSVRYQMVVAALKNEPRLKPASWEFRRSGISYTYLTIARYKKRHPRHEIFFIMGSDSLKGFSKWKNPEKILKNATLVVGRRPGAVITNTVTKKWGNIIVLPGRFPNISSTQIRKMVRQGVRRKKIISSPVWKIIKKKKLYADSSH